MTRLTGLTLALGLTIACVTPARAWVITPPRPGQVGLGVQGQYGLMLESGSVGESFDSGVGLAVRMRYRMRYERAMGLSFESQKFESRDANFDSTRASIFTAGVDLYQMFGTRTRTTKMVSVSAGLAKVSVKLKSGETMFPFGDGVYVGVGAGLERFFYQSWAYDLSGRYMAAFLDGKANHDFQASIGLIFYASY